MSETIEDKEYTEKAISWSNLLGAVEEVIGFGVLILALIINLNQMVSGIYGLLAFDQFFGMFLTQFLPAIGIGVFLITLGRGVKESEIWAFAWVIYGNFISIAVMFILFSGIWLYVAVVCVITVIMLFNTPVKE